MAKMSTFVTMARRKFYGNTLNDVKNSVEIQYSVETLHVERNAAVVFLGYTSIVHGPRENYRVAHNLLQNPHEDWN